MNKFFLTTAIAYVNGAPHIGHVLEFLQADFLARYRRIEGGEVFFLTGTDEHGVKIYEKAKELGMETRDFVEMNAAKFESLVKAIGLSNDSFVRTSLDTHKRGAQKLWMKLVDNGDIYKSVYRGNYCVGCEAFIPEKDLDEEGKCRNHKRKLDVLEEENYFFRLSKYSKLIKEAIENDEVKIVPESRKKEMLNIIGEDGLFDVSFSRPKAVLPWGVEVPNDPNQVMYVWGDALTNYITAIGFADEDLSKFLKWWPCDAHIIGKDILRFHAGIWLGMLLSAGITLPKKIYVHGFITSEGEKMSKSLNNVVDPLLYMEKYGAESLRYFLLREIPTTDDGDFTHARFVSVCNSELANSLGNLVNRVLMMTEKYFEGKVMAFAEDKSLTERIFNCINEYRVAVESYDLKRALEVTMEAANVLNKYIDDKKPWILAKEGKTEELALVMYNLLEALRIVARLLLPALPIKAESILKKLGLELVNENLKLEWGGLTPGLQVHSGEVIFPRIEE